MGERVSHVFPQRWGKGTFGLILVLDICLLEGSPSSSWSSWLLLVSGIVWDWCAVIHSSALGNAVVGAPWTTWPPLTPAGYRHKLPNPPSGPVNLTQASLSYGINTPCTVDTVAFPWLASGNLDLGTDPTTVTAKNELVSLKVFCKQCGLYWTPAFLWESGVLVHARKRMPSNLGHWVSNELPGRQHFTRVVTVIAGVNQAHPERLHRGGLLEDCICFPPDFAPGSFTFCCYCFVSVHCNKSQPCVGLYAESYESS